MAVVRRCLFLLPLLLAVPAAAQQDAAVHVDLRGTTPVVRVSHVLDDPQLRDLMQAGFPVALHFRLELWRTGGLFNAMERSTTWDVIVQYDPAPYEKVYRVVRRTGKESESFGTLPSLDSVQALLAKPYAVPLEPAHPGTRYYYDVGLDVESLRASDLGELERWLHGDVQPAVHGKRNPLSALESGLGRLLSRVLGGAKLNYEATSPTFVAPKP